MLSTPPNEAGDGALLEDRWSPHWLRSVSAPARTKTQHAPKILILDNEPTDAERMQRELRKGHVEFTAKWVGNRADFVEALDTFAPDVLLAGYQLPGFNGGEALAYVRHVHPEIPVIMVTDALGEEAAIALLKAGAADYVLKNNLQRLPSAIDRAISVEQGIRARKGAERALREANALLRTTERIAHIGGFDYDIASGRVVWSEEAYRMFGLSPGEFVPSIASFVECIKPEDRRRVQDAIDATVTRNEPFDIEFRILRPDQTERIIHSRGELVRDEAGKPTGMTGTSHDITERKHAEAQIREDEARFRSLVEQNVAGIVILARDGNIAYINPYWARLNGYTPAEVIGHSVFEYLPEAEKPRVDRELRKLLSPEGVFVQFATSMLTKDGRTVDLLVNASPGTYEGKLATIAVLLDVTESNKAQRELASTAAILATEHELSPDGILVVDPAGDIISVNRRFAEIFGVPAQLLAGKADEPVLAWVVGQVADGAAFLSRVRHLYDHQEESSYDAVALKDGRTLDRYSAPMNAAGGAYCGRVWFFRDITKRKRAEETLRTSEERFRLVIENAPDAILLYDADQDRLIDANKAAERLFACARDEILKHGPQHFYPPNQPDAHPVAQSFAEHGERALAGEQITYEQRICNALGQERLCEVTLVRLPSASPRLLRASFVDITDQKAAERALLRLNRTLRTLGRGNEVLVRNTSEPQLLTEMCQVIVETGGYRMAWIGVPQQDAAKSVAPVAWAGEIGQYLAKAQISWADTPRGRGPHGRAIRSGDPQVTQNFQADPSMEPWLQAAKESGFMSSVVLPLRDASGVFAALMIYAAEIGVFNGDELKLLQELASDLAFGIRTLREHTAHEALNQRWRTSLEATVGAIANTVEMRDPYTAGHQQRVARLAVAMGRELHLPETQIQGIYLAGIIHDVGKIDIPSEILNKPGKLSKLQFQLIQAHAQSGYDIIKGVDFPWPIAQMVLQHHERLDGSGYPQGLKGEAILAEAKILAVADVVEAMMSHRPYRPALGIDAALTEIEHGKGRLFDPAAVEACVALFRQNGFSFE